jgi:hypothetical protein
MATLATQSIKRAGLSPAYAAAAGGGDQFTPGRNTFLHVKNGGGAPITVTVVTPGIALADVPIADLAVVVTNAQERMIGPFPPEFFADPALSGQAAITYSAVTTVTVAAFDLSQP